ncbi:glutathione peroxidase [Hufsiella ginkgonis]|uniref:Glutathione peroxidase n=1 Tax=Hufsiella ginkgonis TaxID=2695274 RepID=A0A7K1XZ94_9SPHI|nr:glutathione peroxidase [Hufsiella ginkgonis]MXV16059.1 redoxin domain-containing protein [Hufsiella ginkgonis]
MKVIALMLTLLLAAPASIYQYKVASIEGKKIDLKKYKGKKVLIVNTASKCGYTPQYAELQQLSEKYKDKLVVIGFPANNFKEQDPGTNLEIKEFCKANYGVTFPLSEKVSVKGDDIDPLFKYLISAENAEGITGDISWNFEKFLVDENGKLIHRFKSKVKPMSEELTRYL